MPPLLRIDTIFSTAHDGNLRLGDSPGEFRETAKRNREALLRPLGLQGSHLVTHIPGSNMGIKFVDTPPANDEDRPIAECIITQTPDLPIGVTNRDCLPILIHDEDHTTVAAIHMSRANLRDNFHEQAIARIQSITKGKLIAHFGPCLRQQSHELGEECVDDFIKARLDAESFFSKTDKTGKYKFNYAELTRKSLNNMGVFDIHDTGIDSFTNHDYSSLRRSNYNILGTCNASIIALRSEMA